MYYSSCVDTGWHPLAAKYLIQFRLAPIVQGCACFFFLLLFFFLVLYNTGLPVFFCFFEQCRAILYSLGEGCPVTVDNAAWQCLSGWWSQTLVNSWVCLNNGREYIQHQRISYNYTKPWQYILQHFHHGINIITIQYFSCNFVTLHQNMTMTIVQHNYSENISQFFH